MRRITALIVLTLLVASLVPLSPASLAGPQDAPIRLKATTFRPGLGEKPDIPPGLTIAEPPAGVTGYYLVQFAGPIRSQWRANLESLGAEVQAYIPDFAYKVRMTPGLAGQVRRLEEVAWVGVFHPGYKISPKLEGIDLLRVVLTDAADEAAMRAEIAALGASVERAEARSWTVRLGAAQVPALARLSEVAWIEAEPEFELHNNIARGSESGMDAYALWATGVYGDGQIAAVADTGLDTNNTSTVHQDFRGRVVQIDVLGDLATDTDGHGTHTSGSIVGNGVESGADPASHDYGQTDATDPNQTTAKVTGIAPEAQLYFQAIACYHPFFGLTLCGLPNDLNQLFQPPYNAGARVHSNSWGADVAGDYDDSSQDVDQFMWNNPDMLVTTSAGNAGIDADNDGWVDEDSMGSPATAKNVLTVGATENARTNGGVNDESGGNDLDELQCSGNGGGVAWRNCWPDDFDASPTGPDPIGGTTNGGHMAAFSSRGPTDDGRIKPDVVAPGTNILSTMSSQASSCGWGLGELGNKYCMNGGTSMSNPLVAGAATLTRDWYEDVKGYANPSAALIKATLINTAVDISGYGTGSQEVGQPIPNNHEGWGMVNLANVAADGRQFYDEDSVGTGGTVSKSFVASGGQPFRMTLVWSDYPASTTASATLVNDLDLKVSAPDGTTIYWGNVFSGGWSQTGGSADRTNNVENVFVQSATAGSWTVQVSGYNVPYGPQPFALVVDGGTSGGDTPPSVSIVSPAEGSTVSGSAAVEIDASDVEDAAGTLAVEWNVDGGVWLPSTYNGTSGYYEAIWDTTAVSDGGHTINARATDRATNVGTDSSSVTVDNINDPPVALFTYSCSDLTCDFDATSSYDPDGSIASYEWDFGDGNTGGGVTPSRSYAAAGTYTVVLTVTDNESATGTDAQDVTVSVAQKMHVGDLDGEKVTSRNKWNATVTVTVHDAGEGLVSGATVSGAWSNGATGTAECTTDASGTCSVTKNSLRSNVPSVTFTVSGVSHSSLTYDSSANHDDEGDSDGTSIVVPPPVGNQPPTASFTSNCTGLNCSFDGSSSNDPDGEIVSFEWTFGDGGTASGATASHTYQIAGTYEVTLTVTDDGGATDSQTQNVPVSLGGGGSMHVGDLDGIGQPVRSKWEAVVTILMEDQNHNPLANATVEGIWSNGATGGASCTTDASGTCTVVKNNLKTDVVSVTFTVDRVTLSGYDYLASDNHDPDPDSDGTTIIVQQPQ